MNPGVCDVSAMVDSKPGWEQEGINLAVGQKLTIQIKVRTVTEVSTAEPASQLDISSGAFTATVGKSEMRDLELNGRSFEQLALLQPGVVAAYSAGSSFYGARTRAISVNGARPEQNNFLLAFTNAAGAMAANQGVITSTVTSSRRIQLVMKLTSDMAVLFRV